MKKRLSNRADCDTITYNDIITSTINKIIYMEMFMFRALGVWSDELEARIDNRGL